MRYLITLCTAFCFLVGCGGDEAAGESGEVGDYCTGADDCVDGICLDELGPDTPDPITFEGGYCTSECEYVDLNEDGYIDVDEYIGCSEDGLCLIYDADPWGATDTEESYCFQKGCFTDWDCRDPDYICMEFGSPPYTPSATACVPLDVRVNDPEEQNVAYYEDEALLFHPLILAQE